MTKYLVFLCCWFSVTGNCQSGCDCFDRLYNLKNIYSGQDKYVAVLKDAVSFLDESTKGDYYWEIGSAYNDRKIYDSSVAYYTKAMEWGYDIESLKYDAWETYIRMDTNRIKDIALNFRKKIDFSLYQKFIRQETLDQSVRNNSLFREDLGDTTLPLCKKAFIDSMFHTVDRSDFKFVKWVLDNYQFPTFHLLGFFPLSFKVYILHITAYKNDEADYIFNRLGELNKICSYPNKSYILMMMDRRKYYNERKSYCGIMGGAQQYFKIEDINKADSIRFEYNQLRIKEEALSDSNKIPESYKPRPYPKNYFCLKKYHFE